MLTKEEKQVARDHAEYAAGLVNGQRINGTWGYDDNL